MEEALLLKELKTILDESKRRGINVFVIGAFCVKAYNSLIRESHDLDFAVVGEGFDPLAQLLKELGFSVHSRNIWVTAEKQIGEEKIAVHIAVNEILDLNSQNSYSIRDEKAFFLQPGELDFKIPALSLSGLLITKLISFRENDVVDIVSLLTNKFEEMNSQELHIKAADSNNLQAIQQRLLELRELFESDEIDAIWYIRLNRPLSTEVKATLLDRINKLLKPFSNSN
jgi:hypothetical protein